MPIRPFRFGVQAHRAASRAEWVELARRVEGNGYSTPGMPDHFDDQLAPVPALQCAADATSTLRLGALVYDNDYKHPVVLAKELATMDVLSDGRVQVGIGAGWTATDYEQSGIPFDAPGVRISLECDRDVDLTGVQRRIEVDRNRIAERDVPRGNPHGRAHTSIRRPRVARTRATTSPILLFGVLAPAVMPTRTGPAGSQLTASASSCFTAATR